MKIRSWADLVSFRGTSQEENKTEYVDENDIHWNKDVYIGHKNAEDSILNLLTIGAITPEQYNERPWFTDVWEVDRYVLQLREGTYKYILPSGSSVQFDNRIVHPEMSSGTAYYPVATFYNGNEIVNWTDFFSGRYKSVVFVKCAYCGSTKGKYEYNLLGHPVCVCCGAEIG